MPGNSSLPTMQRLHKFRGRMTLVTESTIPRHRVPVVTLALVGLNVAFERHDRSEYTRRTRRSCSTTAASTVTTMERRITTSSASGWDRCGHGMPLTLAGHRYH
jgi:hypothetical protein